MAFFKLLPLVLFSFSLQSSALGASEEDLLLSICHTYEVDPAPVPALQVPKCRVIGNTMYIDGVIDPMYYAFELSIRPEIDTIELNSGGGPILEIFQLSDKIRARGIRTHVRKGAVCSSACTLLYMAGVKRSAHSSAKFMFHGVNTGGKPVDMKEQCEFYGFDQCGKNLLIIVDDQRASTLELFQKYISFGAVADFWAEYLRLPMDPNWYEHGNFTQRIDWRMTAEEAMKYNIVQEID